MYTYICTFFMKCIQPQVSMTNMDVDLVHDDKPVDGIANEGVASLKLFSCSCEQRNSI